MILRATAPRLIQRRRFTKWFSAHLLVPFHRMEEIPGPPTPGSSYKVPPRPYGAPFASSLDLLPLWLVWPSDAERSFTYMRNMRTVKLLTETASSSVSFRTFSASDVASDVPPECLLICEVKYRAGESARVAGPGSVSLHSSKRARDMGSYGWNRRLCIGPVLLEPVLS